jgi:hypothetical protein
MFNSLEHGRVVVALSEKKGLVREVAFSTKNPDEVLHVFPAGACRLQSLTTHYGHSQVLKSRANNVVLEKVYLLTIFIHHE